MTMSPGDEPPRDEPLDDSQPTGSRAGDASMPDGAPGWRSRPTDDDVDAAFADIVSRITTDWLSPPDDGRASAAERHPSAGGPIQETGAERARRRELRRLERAEEVAAFAAQQAEIEAERDADDAHFTPPEPPPLPRPKRRTITAVLLIVAGLVLLARPALLAVGVELTMVLAAGLIVGGAYLLLVGIWRRRSADHGDGSDDGAVV